MRISIVIPVLNEASKIGGLLSWLQQTGQEDELLVVDGGSQDETVAIASNAGATVIHAPKGRAMQLNAGAQHAKGDLLYFVHADVQPPASWRNDILQALQTAPAGCFSYCFDRSNPLLAINAYGTRFNGWLTGGGDQTLFIRKTLFFQVGAFDESLLIMEDFDFVWRLKQTFPFKVICKDATVSARKYEENNYFKIQVVNLLTILFFRLGVSNDRLYRFYRFCIK